MPRESRVSRPEQNQGASALLRRGPRAPPFPPPLLLSAMPGRGATGHDLGSAGGGSGSAPCIYGAASKPERAERPAKCSHPRVSALQGRRPVKREVEVTSYRAPRLWKQIGPQFPEVLH